LLVHPSALNPGQPVLPLKQGIRVGSSAARRKAQLHHLRPDLELLELRGNVPTRVEKLLRGDYEAILLAIAGVKRLNLDLSGLHVQLLEPEQLVPAPAQGALALECPTHRPALKALLKQLNDPAAQATVAAERGLLRRLAGGCQLALGATARMGAEGLELLAWYGGQRYSAKHPSPDQVAEAVYQQIRLDHPEVAR
jgi:hydroxymethylbilane synthase